MGNGIDSSIQDVGGFDPFSLEAGRLPWMYVGTKWSWSDFGTPVNLTFSFSDESSSYRDGYSQGLQNGVFGLNAQQQDAAMAAMANYAAVANLTFTGVLESETQAGDIRWANTSNPTMQTAGAFLPYPLAEGGDIWFGGTTTGMDWYYQNPEPGSYGYVTFLHELGHALGLKHAHEDFDGPAAPASHDAMKYSVMSYRDHVGDELDGYESQFFATTLMMDDIYAMQYLYGVNTSTNAGDTTYSWGTTDMIYETIWDGGGNDTIDAANLARGVKISLDDGTFSSIGEYFWNGQADVRDCLGIAYFCEIENATGSAFNDTLNGNELANLLIGNGGKDILNGKLGHDVMTGGAGDDIFRFDSKLGKLKNLDSITDFTIGKDTIQLNNSKFAMLVDGALASDNFRASLNGNAADADDYIVYETDTGKLFYDADGNGAGAKIQFALIGNLATLTAADFTVV